MATNYDVNYNDKRFTDVEADKKAAINEVDQKYGQMIGGVDDKYNALIDESQKWAEQQTQLQKEQTDFTIEKIEEQKTRAEKDYQKEQSGAYVDWQKQSNQYGANAEAMAAQGMAGTGYSESSQVSMYNTYQNRVATAREAFTRVTTDYDIAIKDAQLQNNSVLAEIAHQAQQQRLELILEGFQYKNNLIIDQMNKKQEVDNTYYARYQDVLNQINTENALAEQVRQFNQEYDFKVKEYEESIRQFNQNYELKVKEYEEGIRQFNEEIARLKAQDAKENALKIQQLEMQKQQFAEEQRQFEAQMAEEKRQFNAQMAEEQRQFETQMAEQKRKSSATYTPPGGGGDVGTNKTQPLIKTVDPVKKGFNGTTYNEAVAYLKKYGVSSAQASGLMTQSEWSRRKASYNKTGVGSAAVKNNKTYADYLNEKCEYIIKGLYK